MPADSARRYRAVPIGLNDIGGVIVAVDDPLNFNTLDSVQSIIQRDVEYICTTKASLNAVLTRNYGTAEDAVASLENMVGNITIGDQSVDVAGVEGEGGEAPIIKLVTMMLIEAYNMRPSYIYIGPL